MVKKKKKAQKTVQARESCAELVAPHLKGRMEDLRQLWDAYERGNDDGVEGLGTFHEYGLCFDYVTPGTFEGQTRGYFRYRLSWDGPSDEFRFFCAEGFEVTSVEYWYMDWFDGAKKVLEGDALDLMLEIWAHFLDTGTVQAKYKEARG